MTLHEFAHVVRKRWHMILIGLVCGLAAAAAFLWRTPPEYAARITVYAPVSAEQLDTYARLLTSDRIARDVADRLGLPPGGQVADRLDVSADPGLLTVTATDPAPAQAVRIANASGEAFTRLVAELHGPPGTVVEPATVPTSAVGPDAVRYLGFGALAGLAAGLGSALLRHFRRGPLKTTDQLQALTAAPTLGVLADDPQAVRAPLTVRERPHSRGAEAYRELRANLQFVDVDSARKAITVTSACPEAGKTTLLCNLAVVLAAAGHRVVLVEADLLRPRLAGRLALPSPTGLTAVLAGRVTVGRALRPAAGALFDVLPGGGIPPDPAGLLGSGRMRILLDDLRCRYDMVLVEAPPLLPGSGAAALGAACDGAVLAVRHGKTTHRQVKTALTELRAGGVRLYGTVFTMVPESATGGAGDADQRVTTPLAVLPREPVKTLDGPTSQRLTGALPRNGAGHRR